MSPRCLRADARLIVLAGFGRLQEIELVRKVIEEQQLAIRQEAALALDEAENYAAGDVYGEIGEWIPSPEEIAAACAAIQAGWSEDDSYLHWHSDHLAFIARKYYATHREEVLARNRTEQRRALMRVHANAWKKRNQAQQKESRHNYCQANRERINARKRAYREANKERVNAQNRDWYAKRRQAAQLTVA